MRADVVRSVCVWGGGGGGGGGGGRYTKDMNCKGSSYCGGGWGLQRQTRPSLSNQERKVISNSIIFFEAGNSEQMATTAAGLAATSSSADAFSSGQIHRGFVRFTGRGDACQRVNGIRDGRRAQAPSDSLRLFHLPVLPFALPLQLINADVFVDRKGVVFFSFSTYICPRQ